MSIKYLSPLSDLEAELKALFSNEYMLAFFKNFCDDCDTIESQMWGWKTRRSRIYGNRSGVRAGLITCL